MHRHLVGIVDLWLGDVDSSGQLSTRIIVHNSEEVRLNRTVQSEDQELGHLHQQHLPTHTHHTCTHITHQFQHISIRNTSPTFTSSTSLYSHIHTHTHTHHTSTHTLHISINTSVHSLSLPHFLHFSHTPYTTPVVTSTHAYS